VVLDALDLALRPAAASVHKQTSIEGAFCRYLASSRRFLAQLPSKKPNPWSRFYLYSQKTTTLTLVKDATPNWPTEWFFYLFQLGSRPAVLFPKLTRLTLSSLDGINYILPFHLLEGLRNVHVSDMTETKGRYPAKKTFLPSWMAALASSSSALWKLKLKPTLSKQMALSLSEMSALTTLDVTLPSPVKTDDFVLFNTIPGLKTLILSVDWPGSDATYPEAGKHLAKMHPKQGRSKISTLKLEGDPFFIFWATTFFCSQFLHTFVATIWTTLESRLLPGLLLMPHTFHLVIHYNPKVQQFSFEWDGRLNGSEDWEWEDQRLAIPEGLLESVEKLRQLESLSIKNIPIVDSDFIAELFDALPELPSLHTLCLVPQAAGRDDVLGLPTMDGLAAVCSYFPALQHLTISLEDITDIPSEMPETSERLDAEHKLKSLFIVPRFGELDSELLVSQLIPLATYLNRLFPRLADVTSVFEAKDESKRVGKAPHRTLASWKNLDALLKSYQKIRVDHFKDFIKAMAPSKTSISGA
jgi:hypothetical protein